MTFNTIALIIVGLMVLGAVFLFAVLAVSGREDRASRHIQKTIDLFADITITRPGE
jgi:hypothetical protein